jgi:LmbE family N-acetylglucosaminyl deacetylase
MITVLAVIAHPDDELGCAGSLIKHVDAGDRVIIAACTAGTSGPGRVTDRVHEMECSARVIGAELVWGNFEDGHVSQHEARLVQFIEGVIQDCVVDLVYSHAPHDSHQDHRAVANATLGAARNSQNILQYESPSAINFMPSIFADISDVLERKIEAVECHRTQLASSRMINLDYIRGQAHYRGFQARVLAAEGFIPVRIMFNTIKGSHS